MFAMRAMVIALSIDGLDGSRVRKRLYGEVLVLLHICVLYVYVNAWTNRSQFLLMDRYVVPKRREVWSVVPLDLAVCL